MSVPLKKMNDGVEIPLLGMGTWQQEGEKCEQVVQMALEIGYRHFDTAQQYENHIHVGKGIKNFPREELFITSKLQWDFLEPDLVEPNCDKTLKELQTEYLDLFLIHWPNRSKPLGEVIAKMHELKKKGKIRSVGVSNFTVNHLKDLFDQDLTVSMNQVEFHPYLFQSDLLAFCEKNDVAVTAYSPLGHGELLNDPVLQDIGKRYGKTAGQVCLRWLVQHKIVAIPKGSSEKHMRENIDIFDFELDDDEMEKIHSLNKDMRTIAPSIHEFDY